MSPAILCLIAWLLPAASGYLWAWMYSLPQHPPDEATLGRSAGPGDNLEEVSGGCPHPGYGGPGGEEEGVQLQQGWEQGLQPG